MSIITSIPFPNLQNGQTADATQVDANNTAIVDQVNANAAENGVNSSITALTGLTTPLSVAQGGTGATDLDALAKSGANSDITSLTGLTTPLSVAQGGTGLTAAPSEPTYQIFTTASPGTGTYTTPALCTRIEIEMIGPGGGSGGTGSASQISGGAGGTTTFNSVQALGGQGGFVGVPVIGPGGVGGGASGNGSGTAIDRIQGGPGNDGSAWSNIGGVNNVAPVGVPGASSYYGGGSGGPTLPDAPVAAVVFGAGAGAPPGVTSSWTGAGSGGAGEWVFFAINAPTTTYSYSLGAVGTAGVAGSSGLNGAAGGPTRIRIKEIYT